MIWAVETAPGWAGALPGEIRLEADGTPLVATGQAALVLLDLGAEGGERQTGADWARELGVRAGNRFEEEPNPARGEMCA